LWQDSRRVCGFERHCQPENGGKGVKPTVIISHDNHDFCAGLQSKLQNFDYKTIITSGVNKILHIGIISEFCIVVFDLYDDEFWSFANSDLVDTHLPRASFLPVNAMNYVADESNKIETYYQMVALTAKLSRWRVKAK
jgi:hypothetical protein